MKIDRTDFYVKKLKHPETLHNLKKIQSKLTNTACNPNIYTQIKFVEWKTFSMKTDYNPKIVTFIAFIVSKDDNSVSSSTRYIFNYKFSNVSTAKWPSIINKLHPYFPSDINGTTYRHSKALIVWSPPFFT